MAGKSLVTSVTHSRADVMTGKQKNYWVEIQLVDEQGIAVGNILWKAESHHPTDGRIDQFTYSGQSNTEGLIRIDMPHGLELKLMLEADPLAKEMENRHLRPGRDAEVDSTVRQQAQDSGYYWRYAVLGELVHTPPAIELRDREVLPAFHFPPAKSLNGLILRTNELQKRHVIEICPFRAWELVLHHQDEYSIANAINLGASASLAYADEDPDDVVSITRFFINQCQDLSRLPQLHKSGFVYNTLVHDVPFSHRYYPPVFMDTSRDSSNTNNQHEPLSAEDEVESAKADGDTQLFYVYNTDKIIIAWRGTASLYDVGTDLSFQPVNAKTCEIKKTQCAALVPVGKVHGGFWRGYNRVERKFTEEILKMEQLAGPRNLFICGHSLGGALALIHSAKLMSINPILYTYGMPRTFTRDAVMQLSNITHFRHVNDNDPVPAVPPEVNLDNELYNLWGLPGTLMGYFWAVGEALAYQAVTWGDCFWHHGNPVVFLTATQTREWKECKTTLPAPAGCITIRRLLPVRAKLYLVPALAEQEMQEAGRKQKEFKASLAKVDLETFFPRGSNHQRGFDITFGDHFMTAYMPYINNKLLELIDKAGIMKKRTFTEHLYNVDRFREQLVKNKNEIPEKEFSRNSIFLNVEGLLSMSLSSTLSMSDGNDALIRFSHYGEEAIENA